MSSEESGLEHDLKEAKTESRAFTITHYAATRNAEMKHYGEQQILGKELGKQGVRVVGLLPLLES